MTGEDFVRAKTILNAFVLCRSNGTQQLEMLLLAAFAGLAIIHWLNYRRVFSTWWRAVPGPAFAAGYGLAFALVLPWVPARYAPFIYFQF